MSNLVSSNWVLCLLLCFFIPPGTVKAQPVISSMTIYTGANGASVGILGTNFNTTVANNIVYFGATRATVTFATATNVNVTVPSGATFQQVSLLNSGTNLSCSSVRSFLPSFNSGAFVAGAINFDVKVDFSTTSSNAYGVVIADFDGDGKPDFVVTNNSGASISVYRNTSTTGSISSSSFASPVSFTTGANPAYLKVADLDRDGKLDIVVANSGSGTISIFKNTCSTGSITSSSFAAKVDFSAGSNPFDIAVADFDGDGKPDLAVTNSVSTSNTISVLKNTTTAGSITSSSFSSAITFGTGSIPVKIVAADFDGDGKPDLAVTNNSSNSVSVFLNTSSTGSISSSSFANKVDFTTGTNPRGIFAADMDNDGKFDIVVTNRTSNNISVFRNTSTAGTISSGSFAAQDTFTTGISPYDVTMGDVDGNGKPDFIITNFGATSISVLRNIGSTGSISASTFTAKKDYATGGTGGPYGVAIGDLDGDGKPDIIVANANSSGSVSIFHDNLLLPITNAGQVCVGSTKLLADSTTGGTWTSGATGIATISSTGLVTAISGGMAIVTYTVSGSYDTALITVVALPVITITPVSAAICNGTSTSITASGASAYTWSPGTGLSATTGATVSSNTTTTRTYTVTGTNTAGCVGRATQTITVKPQPFASVITGPNVVCLGAHTTLVDNVAGGTWRSSNTAIATVIGGIVYGVATGTTVISYTVTNSCGSVAATLSFYVKPMQWEGNVSINWNTASNWSCGSVPGRSDDAFIPAGTTFSPALTAADSGTTRNLTIAAGAKITVYSGTKLNIKGNLINNGNITGSGELRMNNSTAQTVSGLGFIDNFDVDNTAGVALASTSRLTIKKVLSVTSGKLTTNDSVVLFSDSSGSARVAVLPSGSSVVGNVRIQQYFTGGRRAYRFWAHPFNSYIPLSQLTNFIDISGSGGAVNGFTTTASNAPSAYWYNTYGGNSSMPYDPGWRPFTSAYGTPDSNKFERYEGIRLFYRGAKGEGLGFGSYQISPTVVSQWGELNQGNQDIGMHRGTSTLRDYNMIGNPYASPVDIGTVIFNAAAAGRINGAYFYVWNPFLNTSGNFIAVPYSTGGASPKAIPYYLQANDAFQVRTLHDGDLLNFTESNKSANSTSPYSLMKSSQESVSLSIYDGNYYPYDNFTLNFDSNATTVEDIKYDGGKPSVPDFNFYSLSADNQKLMVDTRPYQTESTISLGVISNFEQNYIIRAENLILPAGGLVYLHDSWLQQYVLLQQGTEYPFSVTKDSGSQGEHRFELRISPADIAVIQKNISSQVKMTPNPATDNVKISFAFTEKNQVGIRVMEPSGECVYHLDLGIKDAGTVTIPVSQFARGMYLIELTSGSEIIVQKLIKE